MSGRYRKQRLDVTNATWTPLIPAQRHDFFSLRCPTSDLLIRTDLNDATTEDTLTAGMQESVVAGGGSQLETPDFYYTSVRFQAGESVCWLKSVAPTATVIVTWVS